MMSAIIQQKVRKMAFLRIIEPKTMSLFSKFIKPFGLSLDFFVLILILTACGGGGSGPQAWIDQPLDDTEHLAQVAITIQAHASAEGGIDRFEFYINDQLQNTVSAAGARLGEAAIQWIPGEAATYAVKVRAFDQDGNPGPFARATIHVLGTQAIAGTPVADGLFLEPTVTTGAQAVETTFASINHVECGEDGVVYADISIGNPQGISSYALFSTWVEVETSESFSPPYPTNIEKRVQLIEPTVDSVDRDHQLGLHVIYADASDPYLTYAMEPQGRCPGHYTLDVGDPGPIAPLVTARQNSNCRAGTSLEFEVLGFLLEGQTATIEGRDNLGQWYVITAPDTGKACWIAAGLGDVEGDITGVTIIATPDPPIVVEPDELGEGSQDPPPAGGGSPADNTPPQVTIDEVDPTQILTDGQGCSGYARTTVVTVTATDDVGISSVVANWSVGGESGQVSLISIGGDTYQGQIGPVNSTGAMSITIVAQDASGNSTQSAAPSVDVQNCIN